MTRRNESASGLSDEVLQRYFDGELSAAERVEVEARLDAEARLKLEALGELRGLLRAHAGDEASGVDLSATFSAIERAPRAAARPRRRWVPMSALGGMLAAAAAFLIFLRPFEPKRGVSNVAEVESLEVQGAIATVFRTSDGDDGATVIWAEEPEGNDDGDEADEQETP